MTQKFSMSCRKCGGSYNVLAEAPNSLYRCPNCSGVLLANPAPITISDRDTPSISQTESGLPNDVKIALATGGNTIGKFLLVEPIGRGGFGQVYKAFDLELERIVALKLLQPHSEIDIERTRLEAQLAGKLQVGGIPRIFETGVVGETTYIAMEYVAGKPASDLRLSHEETVRVCRDVALSLHEVHSRGIVHRDIKPSNIIVDKSGRAWLTDFGIAKVSNSKSGLTKTGDIIGTPHFMSPEQASGKHKDVDARSDIFSLGATLYYLLSNSFPFTGKNAFDLMRSVMLADPVPLTRLDTSIPHELEAVANKALQKEKDKRYGSAKEFAEELIRYLNGEPVRARRTSVVEHLTRRMRKTKSSLIFIGTVGAIILACGLILTEANRSTKEEIAKANAADEKAHNTVESQKKLILAFLDHMKGALSEATSMRRSGAKKNELEGISRSTEFLYDKLSQMGIRNADVHHALGRLYRETSNFPDATKHQRIALGISPQHAHAQCELAMLKAADYFARFTHLANMMCQMNSSSLLAELGWNPYKDRILLPSRNWFEAQNVPLVKLREDAQKELELAGKLLQKDSTEYHVVNATTLLLADKLNDAKSAIADVLTTDPSNGDALFLSIEILKRTAAAEVPLKELDKAIALDKGNHEFILNRAILTYEAAAFTKPGDESAIVHLRKALSDLSTVIDLAGENFSAAYFRGCVHEKIGLYNAKRGESPWEEYASAIADLEKARELNPAEFSAHFAIASLKLKCAVHKARTNQPAQAEFAAASASLDEFLARVPNVGGVFRLVMISPETAKATLGPGYLDMATRMLEDLTNELQSNILDGAANACVHWLLGLARMKIAEIGFLVGRNPMKELRNAFDEIDFAAESDTENPDIRLARAEALNEMGKYLSESGGELGDIFQRAIEDIDFARKWNHANQAALLLLADVQIGWSGHEMKSSIDPRERLLQSVKNLNAFLEKDPDNPSAHCMRGEAFLKIGNCRVSQSENPIEEYQAAINSFTETLRRNPENLQALSGRGSAHGNLGLHIQSLGNDPRQSYKFANDDLLEYQNKKRYKRVHEKAGVHSDRGRFSLHLAEYLKKEKLPYSALAKSALEEMKAAVRLRPTLEENLAPLIKRAQEHLSELDY